MLDYINSFPESERGGAFVLVTEDNRVISNYGGEEQNWEVIQLPPVSSDDPPLTDPGGTSGSTGSSGTSGTSGSTGSTGSGGTTGTSGSSGTTGTTGTSGSTGTTGSSGTTGTNGTTSGTTGQDPGQCKASNEIRESADPEVPCDCSGVLAQQITSGYNPNRGSGTGTFRRVTSNWGFNAISGDVFLPPNISIVGAQVPQQNGAPVTNGHFDSPHVYFSGEWVDNIQSPAPNYLNYEGGFKFDFIPSPDGLNHWKPFISRRGSGLGYVQVQPKQSSNRFISGGKTYSSALLQTKFGSFVAVSFTFSGLTEKFTFGFLGNQQQFMTPTHTRMNRIGAIAQEIQYYDINSQTWGYKSAIDIERDSKICGIRFSNTKVTSYDGTQITAYDMDLSKIEQAISNPPHSRPSDGQFYVNQLPGSGSVLINNGEPWTNESISIKLGESE